MRQVEQMRVDGRINMYARSELSGRTTAYMWICHKIKECAERIRKESTRKNIGICPGGNTKTPYVVTI
ncbi:MAG: hypothetical protein ACLTS6_17665 [Anaerobutyricum sp.]